MALVKLLGIVWLLLLGIFIIGLIFGYYVENKVTDDKPLKKWWRKHIVGKDPGEEHFWKNFNG